MSAFAAPLSVGSHHVTSVTVSHDMQMCARTPGDTAAPPSKYAQFISPDRLNKAPMISLGSFPNEEANYISVSLNTVRAEESAAASLKGYENGHNPSDSGQADPALWSQYYDPATVNQAPFIFICGQATGVGNFMNKLSIGLSMKAVPLQVRLPADILANDPKPSLPWRPTNMAMTGALMPYSNGKPNWAPAISMADLNDPFGKDTVGVAMEPCIGIPAAAEYILKKYRK